MIDQAQEFVPKQDSKYQLDGVFAGSGFKGTLGDFPLFNLWQAGFRVIQAEVVNREGLEVTNALKQAGC